MADDPPSNTNTYRSLPHHSADLDSWRSTYGFLYSSFRKECWYWEVVVVLRKVAFASAAVLLQPVGVDLQANLGVIVVVASLALQLYFRPYINPKLDKLEAAGLTAAFLTLRQATLVTTVPPPPHTPFPLPYPYTPPCILLKYKTKTAHFVFEQCLERLPDFISPVTMAFLHGGS